MPPKRMSDFLASSPDTRTPSTPLTAAAPSSEGPTLPLVGTTGEQNGKKRKRTTASSNDAAKPNKAAAPKKAPHTNHPSLYEPWTLLPLRERRAIESHGTRNVVPLVYSKNQNVRSGIMKLLRLLGAQPGGGGEAPAVLEDEQGVLAVSAQGEGTVKLVGIVDMVRRIAGATGEGEATKWCVYTVLSSVEVPRRRVTGDDGGKAREREDEGDAEAMDIDEHGAVETQRSSKNEDAETKKLPVLTVWLSRKTIPGWEEAFGEQVLFVRLPDDHEV